MFLIGDKIGAKAVIVVGGVVSFVCCFVFGYILVLYIFMGLWVLNGFV